MNIEREWGERDEENQIDIYEKEIERYKQRDSLVSF